MTELEELAENVRHWRDPESDCGNYYTIKHERLQRLVNIAFLAKELCEYLPAIIGDIPRHELEEALEAMG